MTAGAPAQPALATAVHEGRWVEVRAATEAMARPLPAAVALVAARAAARVGATREALKLLRDALPRAGELTAALRLEGGAIVLSRGESPWPWIGALTRRGVPAGQRRAAGDLLRLSWQSLPVAALRQQPSHALSRALRRELTATLAIRSGDAPIAYRLLGEGRDDEPAVRVAHWLIERGTPSGGVRLAAAEALLAAGSWREAETLLAGEQAAAPERLRSRVAFVRGRAAYRLGALAEAAQRFDAALATATTDPDRFAAAVQRARVAELAGERARALPLWEVARRAGPKEVEGWDGGARELAALGRCEDALALLRAAPAPVLRVAGPRLAAMLLAKGELARAGTLLALLPQHVVAARALRVALAARLGDDVGARAAATELLADPGAGPWRSLVLGLLPPPAAAAGGGEPPATRDPRALAALALGRGPDVARVALARALAADPAWSALLAGNVLAPPEWSGPAADLVVVGLEGEAAALYSDRFPSATPADLAWTAATLAAWNNGPAALAAGERLEEELGDLPRALLPDALLAAVMPTALVAECVAAAGEAGVSPAWLVAVVRQESRFDGRARSQAGALGIAQVLPETARRLGAAPSELWDPGRALTLAARELSRIAQRFGPRLAVAAAAYNAGDEVVASWLAALGGVPDELVFAAAVPYSETADYVLEVCDGAFLARCL